MSPRALGYLVQRYLAPAGIEGKHVSPHASRHTFALRALLGHAQVATTQVYLDHLDNLAMEDLRAALPDLAVGGGARER